MAPSSCTLGCGAHAGGPCSLHSSHPLCQAPQASQRPLWNSERKGGLGTLNGLPVPGADGEEQQPPARPAGIPRMLRQGHVSLGFKVPSLGGCPEVRSSEPAVGTYPHNRFHDQTPCPCVPTCPVVYLQRPVISLSLSLTLTAQ